VFVASTGMAALAVPFVAPTFGVPGSTGAWIVTAYAASSGSGMPYVGVLRIGSASAGSTPA